MRLTIELRSPLPPAAPGRDAFGAGLPPASNGPGLPIALDAGDIMNAPGGAVNPQGPHSANARPETASELVSALLELILKLLLEILGIDPKNTGPQVQSRHAPQGIGGGEDYGDAGAGGGYGDTGGYGDAGGSEAAEGEGGAEGAEGAESGEGWAPSASGKDTVPSKSGDPALDRWDKDIEAASKATGVPANYIKATMKSESSGNPNVMTKNPEMKDKYGNPCIDRGLMQISKETYEELVKNGEAPPGLDVTKPADNIMAGAYELKSKLKKAGGDYKAASAAYVGTGNQEYVDVVYANFMRLNRGEGNLDWVGS